jgi:hypothetical protein
MPTSRSSITSARPTPWREPRADLVQQRHHLDRVQLLAVHAHRVAVLEPDLDELGRIGRVLGSNRPAEHALLGLVPRILERAALVRDVPEVLISRIELRLIHSRERDAAGARVRERVLTRADVPLAPRRDHLQMRRERRVGQLEAHLIVALPRAAV